MGAEAYIMPIIIVAAEVFFIYFLVNDKKKYNNLAMYVTDTSLVKRKKIFRVLLIIANVIIIINMITYIYNYSQYKYYYNGVLQGIRVGQFDSNISNAEYYFADLCTRTLVICGVLVVLSIIDIILISKCNKIIKESYDSYASKAVTAAAKRFCGNCGEPIPEDSSFCVNCGQKL